LAGLKPLAGGLDRDQLLFRAGQRSVPRRPWAWPCLAASLGLSALLAALWAIRPGQMIERVVYVTLPSTSGPATPSPVPPLEPAAAKALVADAEAPPRATAEYLQLRNAVVRWGADALPELRPAPVEEEPLTVDNLLGPPGRSPF
jgi:hypothetical protein